MIVGLQSKEQVAGPGTGRREQVGPTGLGRRKEQATEPGKDHQEQATRLRCLLLTSIELRRPHLLLAAVLGPAACSLLPSPTAIACFAQLLLSPAACFSWPLPGLALSLGQYQAPPPPWSLSSPPCRTCSSLPLSGLPSPGTGFFPPRLLPVPRVLVGHLRLAATLCSHSTIPRRTTFSRWTIQSTASATCWLRSDAT